jgi:hypothetical protein
MGAMFCSSWRTIASVKWKEHERKSAMVLVVPGVNIGNIKLL